MSWTSLWSSLAQDLRNTGFTRQSHGRGKKMLLNQHYQLESSKEKCVKCVQIAPYRE